MTNRSESPADQESAQLPARTGGPVMVEDPNRRLVFQLAIPIRWGDMDAMGHVNNTVYFRYMEQLRISWLDAMGVPPQGGDEGPVIINAFCSFLQELRYPGNVLGRLYVGDLGRSSLQTFVDISREDDPSILCASGGAKVVWVDYPSRSSRPIPAELRKLMTGPAGLLRDES